MDLDKAFKCTQLIKDRDVILDMSEAAVTKEKCGWSFMINDRKIPIPAEVKPIFFEAIRKAVEYYESEIEKL